MSWRLASSSDLPTCLVAYRFCYSLVSSIKCIQLLHSNEYGICASKAINPKRKGFPEVATD